LEIMPKSGIYVELKWDYMVQGVPYPPSGFSELDNGVVPSGRESGLGSTKQPERFINESHYGDVIHPSSQYRSPSVVNGIRDYEDQQAAYIQDGLGEERMHRGLSERMSNLSFSQSQQDQNGVRWRNPDLPEVIAFLSNPDKDVRANAAAYLQHLSYNSDNIKQKTRHLGGLPPLVALLDDDNTDVYRNACGALRAKEKVYTQKRQEGKSTTVSLKNPNLSYGRQNDENKRSIQRAGGVTALVRLLRKSKAEEVHELATSVLWNLSSCEELKRPIIDESLSTVVSLVLFPHSGYDQNNPVTPHWSTVLRNTTGILRNISSAGEYARKVLREANGLVECLLYLVRVSVQVNDIENKSVENSVCVLRNLSYRCQEIEDPNYDRYPVPSQTRATAQPTSENFGCFGATKKKKDAMASPGSTAPGIAPSDGTREKVPGGNLERTEPPKGMELLWQPDVSKYAMRDLVQKLPTGNASQDQATSDETISAVLATLNEVIKKNAEFSRSLLEAEGVPRLINLARPRQ
ncbi:hypothetical protein QYM36_009275, partial [Artemia franciscana]